MTLRMDGGEGRRVVGRIAQSLGNEAPSPDMDVNT